MKLSTCFIITSIIPGLCVPLTAKIQDPYAAKKNMEYLTKKVQPKIDEIISKMVPVVQRPDEPYHHHILQTCFGEKYQAEMPQIRQNIETLAKGGILVDKTLSKVYQGQTAVFVHSSKSIWLFDNFYRLSVAEGALAVIHEASHALLGTEDVFSKDGHFTVVKQTPYATPQGYVGYIDRDFKALRAAAPAKIMVQNADSYRLLGHLASIGFQDLGRDHPMSDWVIDGVPAPEKPESGKKEPTKKKGWFS